MRIFIDESGAFKPGASVCCVATLAVADSCLDELAIVHHQLMSEFNIADELKGRTLGEFQFDRVFTALRRMNVVLNIVAIDMALHDNALVSAHTNEQANRILESVVGPQYLPEKKHEFEQIANRMRSLPNPLYVQARVLTEAFYDTVQAAMIHFAQTEPATLHGFKWCVDAKERQTTEHENLWSSTLPYFLRKMSSRTPLAMPPGLDYSAMAPLMSGPAQAINAHDLASDLSFIDSRLEPGLQLVDVFASAFTRACNYHLQPAGWQQLPHFMIQNIRTLRAVDMVTLDQHRLQEAFKYGAILEWINKTARHPGFRQGRT